MTKHYWSIKHVRKDLTVLDSVAGIKVHGLAEILLGIENEHKCVQPK